MMKMGGVRLQ